MLAKSSISALYTSVYDEMAIQAFEVEGGGVMQSAFTEKTTNQSNYLVDDISGFGFWEDQDELVSSNSEDPVAGYPKTYTIGKKTKMFQVSFEAVDQDEYALMKKQGTAEGYGRAGMQTARKDAALVLYQGFSVACPDGQFLWDNDHPKNREETGTIYDNLLAGAFSHDALEDAETQIAANFFDMKGLPISITEDPILAYPPALRGVVQRVLSERAVERPGTTSRDINQFTTRKGFFQYRPIEDVYLSAALGGSDTAWYILFPKLGYLKFVWNKKPQFNSWVDYEIDAYNFKGRMLYAVGCDNWRAGFASTGA